MNTFNTNSVQLLTSETIALINECSNSRMAASMANSESNDYAEIFVRREIPAGKRSALVLALNKSVVSFASNNC